MTNEVFNQEFNDAIQSVGKLTYQQWNELKAAVEDSFDSAIRPINRAAAEMRNSVKAPVLTPFAVAPTNDRTS